MVVTLNELEQKIVKALLYYGNYESDRRGRPEDIFSKIEFKGKTKVSNPSNYIQTKISQLRPKLQELGIHISQTKSDIYRQNVYWIDSKYKEDLSGLEVFEKSKDLTRVLYLGELGWGTKAHDIRAERGLREILKRNYIGKKSMLDSLDAVILNGGVLPFVPEFHSKAKGENYMRLLGTKVFDREDEPVRIAKEEALKKSDLPEAEKEHMLKHTMHKIITIKDGQAVSRRNLETLLGDDFKGQIHCLFGDEDVENIRERQEIKMSELASVQKYLESTNKKIAKLEEKQVELKISRDLEEKTSRILDSILASTIEYNKEYGLKEYSEIFLKYVELNKKDFLALNQIVPEAGYDLMEFVRSAKQEKKVVGRVDKAKEAVIGIEQRLEDIDEEIVALQDILKAKETEHQSKGFYAFAKRRQIRPDEETLIWRTVFKEYEHIFKDVGRSYKNFFVHPENRKDIEINGWSFRLEHNPNLYSDSPLKQSLKLMIDKVNRETARGGPKTDVYLSVHGKGGFRAKIEEKYREETVEGIYTEIPEMEVLIKQPTFYAPGNMDYLIRNRILKNWIAKMYGSDATAMGAVIHTLEPDGRQKMSYFDMSILLRASYDAEQIEVYKKTLERENLTGETRTSLEASIKDLEKGLQLGTLKKRKSKNDDGYNLFQIHVMGDVHIGSPSFRGRLSNYDIFKATIELQMKERIPEYLFGSEWLHGSLNWSKFASDKSGYGLLRHQIANTVELIKKDETITDREKVELLSEFALVADSYNVKPTLDQQISEVKHMIDAYARKVITKGGKFYFAAGNHTGTSTKISDEAFIMKNLVPMELEYGVVPFKTRGSSQGMGEDYLHDGRKLFMAHALKGGKDELINAMDQIIGTRTEADIVVAFDKHHPMIGFAENKIFVAATGMQSYNEYVNEVSKMPGVRGGINLYLSDNPNMKSYFEAEFIFEETLVNGLPELEKRRDLQQTLTENFIDYK